MDPQLQNYCSRWTTHVAAMDEQDQDARVSYFREQLPLLLLDHHVIRSVLKRMAQGRQWPDLRRPGIFNHEVLLYLDPSRRFSLRLYFHPPRTHTVIHDHTSWGISGTPFGKLSVISYTRNGKIKNGHARLYPKSQRVLAPGEVDLTLPWDDGIHKTGSADDRLNVMISIYGRPGRRLYVNRYDETSGRVERLYPPRLLRRNLAGEALGFYE